MHKRAIYSNKVLPYLLLAPQMAVVLVFFYWPASQAVWQSFLLQDAFGLKTDFVWLENYQVITSPVTGVFRATVRDGYAIAEGGLLGELYDAFGAKVDDVRAHFAGIVNYVVGTPPAVEGQPLAMVSRIAAAPQ